MRVCLSSENQQFQIWRRSADAICRLKLKSRRSAELTPKSHDEGPGLSGIEGPGLSGIEGPGLSSPWLAATLTSPSSTSFFRHTRISWASGLGLSLTTWNAKPTPSASNLHLLLFSASPLLSFSVSPFLRFSPSPLLSFSPSPVRGAAAAGLRFAVWWGIIGQSSGGDEGYGVVSSCTSFMRFRRRYKKWTQQFGLR